MIGDDEDELSKSALLAFRVKEEEIRKKKMEVREKVHAHLGRVEEETKKLAEIREVCTLTFNLHSTLHLLFKTTFWLDC